MKIKLRWLLTNGLMLGMAVAWLFHFFCIYRYGSHYVQEPAMPMLLTEIAFFIGIIGLAIFNLIISSKED